MNPRIMDIQTSDGLFISVRDDSVGGSERELHMRALLFLIDEAGLHTWGKEISPDDGDYFSVWTNFFRDVLASLALRYKCEAGLYKPADDPTKARPQTLRDVMAEMLTMLDEAGHLDTVIRRPSEDDDYDDHGDKDEDEDGMPLIADPRLN